MNPTRKSVPPEWAAVGEKLYALEPDAIANLIDVAHAIINANRRRQRNERRRAARRAGGAA